MIAHEEADFAFVDGRDECVSKVSPTEIHADGNLLDTVSIPNRFCSLGGLLCEKVEQNQAKTLRGQLIREFEP